MKKRVNYPLTRLLLGALLWAAWGLIAPSPAQNARVAALGGNFLIDEISRAIEYPSLGAAAGDFLQASAYADGSSGLALGMKSIGNRGSIGFVANQQSQLISDFYDDALRCVDSLHLDGDSLPEAFTVYPHLLFSIYLPWLTLGCDLFYEGSKLSHAFTSAAGKESRYRAEITNPGLELISSFATEVISISPFFDVSLPEAKGSAVIPDSVSQESGTANGLARGVGVEFRADLPEIDLCSGAYYALENYQFYCRKNAVFRYGPRYRTSLVSIYGGVIAYPVEGLITSVLYSFDRMVSNTRFEKPNATVNDVSETSTFHKAVGSVEYKWSPNRVFDAASIRGGLSCCCLIKTYSVLEDLASAVTKNETAYPAELSKVMPTIGFGLERSGVQLDIAADLGKWTGIFTGPSVIMGTVTWFFAAKRGHH